ncbi:Cytochrome c oxidase assembly protein cox11, mitochondrial [Sporothrix stenoceras]|uniref:Cytochrome c oxidase assembly protein cox11, mitochondrial n=1 Tax=Sporothrix stenoceras TaxID=5173 RepID=A0ABR3YGZ3_9PEZI
MTFSVCRDRGAFEWSGTNLDALFCQRSNFFSPRMWRLVFDVVRFNQFAVDLIRDDESAPGTTPEESIGEYLDREGYSDAFRDDYLIPMTAAVWSTSPDKCSLEFPATTLVRFLYVFAADSVPAYAPSSPSVSVRLSRRPDWLTIDAGSKAYIDAVLKDFPPSHIFLNTAVKSVENEPDGRIRLHLGGGESVVYDHVILATHGDEAFEIIGAAATDEEKDIMSCFHTSQNDAVLHSDVSMLPAARRAWASWNYLSLSSPDGQTGSVIDRVSLTYNMNILQHIPTDTFGHVLVTLNPLSEPDAETVQGRYSYTHPLFTAAAVRAQQLLPRIQNTRGISYAGAWTKYGFHEDGFSSGLAVATQHLGAKLPFDFVDSTYSRGRSPELGIASWLLRFVLWAIQLCLVATVERLSGISRTARHRPKPSTMVRGDTREVKARKAE